MGFNEDLIDALRERQADNTTPDGRQLFSTWNGEDYPCCAGEAMSGKTLGIGGYTADADLVLFFVTEDFVAGFQTAADLIGKHPNPKQTLAYNGKKYTVENVKFAPGLAFFSVELSSSKGV